MAKTRKVKFELASNGEFVYEVDGITLGPDGVVKYASGDTLEFETASGPFSVKLTKSIGPKGDSAFKSGALSLEGKQLQVPGGDPFWIARDEVRNDLSEGEINLFRETNLAKHGHAFVSRYDYEFTLTTAQGARADTRSGERDC